LALDPPKRLSVAHRMSVCTCTAAATSSRTRGGRTRTAPRRIRRLRR
jgi:hypothetical protein